MASEPQIGTRPGGAGLAGVPASKISVPPPRGAGIPRERLLARLGPPEALRGVCVVCAPAGCGKTTAVAQWLRRAGGAVRLAWLSGDESDQDGARFMRSLVASLLRVLPDLSTNALLGLGGVHPSKPIEVMALLCSELDRHAGSPLLVVIDDYHFVSTGDTDAAIALLAENLPAHVGLLLTSRRLPSLPLARWRAQGRLREFDESDLRFSCDETAAFLRGTMALQLSDEVVRTLEQRTEGWAVGLQLAALSIDERAGQPLAQAARFGGRHHSVGAYLAEEVLMRQEPAVREFLLRTAVLGRFDRALCEAVGAAPAGEDLLGQLECLHLFLVPLDDEHRWFRYHQLFADYLCSLVPADQARALHAAASRWYEQHGALDDAIRHAALATDHELSIRLFRAHFEELMCRGEIHTLMGVIASVPEATLLRHPDLAAFKAWLLFLTGRTAEARLFEAGSALSLQTARVGDMPLARTLVLQAYFALNWGDPAQALGLTRQALGMLDQRSPYFRVLAMTYLGQAQALVGQRDEAVATLRNAYYLGDAVGNPPKAMDALAHLAPLLRDQGRLLEGVALCRMAVERYRDAHGEPMPFTGPAYCALGMLQYELNDLADARATLETAERLARRAGWLWFHLMSLCWLARVEHACGDRRDAWQTLARARELAEAGDGPRRRHAVAQLAFELHLRERNLESAEEQLAHGLAGANASTDCLVLLRAGLSMARHQVDGALLALQSLEASTKQQRQDGLRVRALVMQALCHDAAGRSRLAAQVLRSALALAAPRQLRRAFVDVGPALPRLLAQVHDTETAFIDSLQLLPADAAAGPATACPLEALSERDVALLQLLGRGLQNKEIAESLSITLGTTKQYVNRLFGKLGVRNRVEAVALGRELKVLH